MVERGGEDGGSLQDLWHEWNRYQHEARQLWAQSVQMHAEGDQRGCEKAESEARLAERRSRQIEDQITDTSPQSIEDALVYARLLADFVGDGHLDDRRDAQIANKLIVILENLVKLSDNDPTPT